MKNILKEIQKHFIIYCLFIRNNVMSQMEYRTNFFTGIAMEIGFLFVKILYPVVIYQSRAKISGFTPDEFLIFVGTYVIITGFYAGLFMRNFIFFKFLIREGIMDMMITRPVSLQFFSTLKQSNIGIFLMDVGISISFFKILGYVIFIGTGSIITYSIFLIPAIFNFWFINAGIVETVNSFWDFNIVPMIIYDKFIQRIGIFILPIFVITNFPTLFILNKLSPIYFAWGLLVSIIFLILSRIFWNIAVKNYTSASS